MKARGHSAVMSSRQEPPNSLDFFPTPPWATRALVEYVLRPTGCLTFAASHGVSAWEPAAGEGHMAKVLAETFRPVLASDVFDYDRGYLIGSFVGQGADVIKAKADWIITNPPFSLAVEFAERALLCAADGVALLVRSVWAEGGDRYRRLFAERPPSIIAQFCERVPMTKGRWDPKASTATSYAWFIWRLPPARRTSFIWIPPGCRASLTRPDDAARFAGRA